MEKIILELTTWIPLEAATTLGRVSKSGNFQENQNVKG
jgi:hypothetical protein